MLDSSRIDTCSVSYIESLIEVKSPYFALNSLLVDSDGWLSAKAPVECHSLYEKTLMDASEVGRHLAILGACSGALANPEKTKHYYLAYQAELKTYQSYISHSRPDHLYGRAKAKFINKRELIAETELVDLSGNVSASLVVQYHVMKDKSFNRIYGHAPDKVVVDNSRNNPYNKSVNLDVLHVDNESLSASIGEVTPEMCLGHFDGVKALPVAILSQCFLNSSYIFLTNMLGKFDVKFALKSCDLRAEKLAISGQRVNIDVQYIEGTNESFTTNCIATNQSGEIVGEMRCFIDKV